jgi:DNA-binding response OmpR family regulator
MLRSLIIAQENKIHEELCKSLTENGLVCSITPYDNRVTKTIASQKPNIVLLEMDQQLPDNETRELIQSLKKDMCLPVIALIPREMLNGIDRQHNVDDFVISPYDSKELVLRINRLIHGTRNLESSELIKCAGLAIDLVTCEVTVAGKIVELTFKEYELLKFLASNRGRVYTREALLDRVWGYDYYGGDRTVDVHVRRLRSKIEDSNFSFIETVRNVGYRFKKVA